MTTYNEQEAVMQGIAERFAKAAEELRRHEPRRFQRRRGEAGIRAELRTRRNDRDQRQFRL